MKTILVACGSGVATSTVANQKITSFLDENGWKGQYKIVQCQVSEVSEKSKSADFCVATTVVTGEVSCPVIPGLPLLTGIGVDGLFQSVLAEMQK
ncbi:MAG: PTS sugar transporter subunit IIB [Eubacteriales bacterium]|nr:PTS sugar transporter subunit IIB [Eubacteriales bacterium]